MDRGVSDDPAVALTAADRDRLLKYLGFMTGERFEVEVAGRRLVLPAASVNGFVARLRAIEDLRRARVDVRLVELVDGESATVLDVIGWKRTTLADVDVVAWCSGFRAALAGGAQPQHVGEDQVHELRELFERPSLSDQQRMVILGLMHGRGPRQRVTQADLVKRTGRAKKTILDALKFGKTLSPALSESLVKALGMQWSIADGGVQPLGGSRRLKSLPEAPELVRLRRIVEAARAGWIRYLGEPSPNQARRLVEYPVAVGARTYVVSTGDLVAWLDGVAAFHGSVYADHRGGS